MAFHIDKPDATLTRIIGAAFPDYTGRKIQFKETGPDGAVSISGNFWDGGSRSYWTAVDLADFRAKSLPGQNPLQNAQAHRVNLPPGFVMVEHVIFCGKDLGIRIHVRPDNLAPLLPPKAETTEDENIVLDATGSLKSSYGGIKDFRFHEAQRRTGITRERWDVAKAACIARGLLNKAGAITADGRNARQRTNRF